MLLATMALVLGGMAPGAEELQVDLSWRTLRNWDIQLPAEQFRKLSGGFLVTHAGGDRIPAVLDGTALFVDSDGDGIPDKRVEGKADDTGARRAVVTLKVQGKDGGEQTFAARLQDLGRGWEYAVSGVMQGKVGNTKVRLVDQDANGRYDDVGVDAILVGRGNIACLLGEAIQLEGALHSLTVAADGSSLTVGPFEGDQGTLDLRSELKSAGKLQSLVVISVDGRYSFDLAKARAGLPVPAGRYVIHSGQFGLLDNIANVTQGRMDPIDVPANEETAIRWGAPLNAEFLYQRAGDQVMFDPSQVTYFGAAGEEYKVWDPAGKSPEFLIRDLRSGAEIAKAMFPGSC